MIIDLTDTLSSQINATIVRARRGAGRQAVGMVLTLVIVTEEKDHYDALKAASEAAREHPCRILVVIRRPGRGPSRLDAEVRLGGESGPGETVVLRLHGELAEHASSVVLPLLLPDAPVVTWWPGTAPAVPGEDPLGALAQRRVTDAAAASDDVRDLLERAKSYHPGDTDLAWTRLTPWRSMLAAALDQRPTASVAEASVAAEPNNPSAELLALWLADRLGVPVRRQESEGPGITQVWLAIPDGRITLNRPDGRLATLAMPGQPERRVALKRREAAELIAEELRRLDPDEVYERTISLGPRGLADGELVNVGATALGAADGASGADGRHRRPPAPRPGAGQPEQGADVAAAIESAAAASSKAATAPDEPPEQERAESDPRRRSDQDASETRGGEGG